MANLDVSSQMRSSAAERKLGHHRSSLRPKVRTKINLFTTLPKINHSLNPKQKSIHSFEFQRSTERPAPTNRRARPGQRGGALRLPGAARSNSRKSSELRSAHVRVRSGADALLRACPTLPAERTTYLRTRRRRGLRRSDGLCHGLG